jgi:hypothetical protein
MLLAFATIIYGGDAFKKKKTKNKLDFSPRWKLTINR